jgi:hypothetical protein
MGFIISSIFNNMIRYARTYGSRLYKDNFADAWQFPTGPVADIFGVPVTISNKTFGLEEFNFSKILRDLKLAYVPCYGNARFFLRPFIKELHLIFKTEGRNHIHYATLHNVTPIKDEEICEIRKLLQSHIHEIYFNASAQEFFQNDFSQFQDQIQFMYNQNRIAANQINASFLVNLRYEELTILKEPVTLDVYPGYVGQWKVNVMTSPK